jgi:voltage-gated potassium channel
VVAGNTPGGSGTDARDAALRELFDHDERVPLVYWRRFSGARTTVLLTGVVAALAFVTGLSHLSRGAVTLDGPLGPWLPPGVEGLVAPAGVTLGFLLAATTAGLQRRFRVAWWGAAVAVPTAVLVPLLTAEPSDVLLFVAAAVTLPSVVRNRARFDRPLDLSPFQLVALAAIAGVQVYGTVGAYVLRSQYTGIETWTDAVYYVVVTGTTVGYGDATPTTGTAKLFTLSVLVVGTAAFGAAFGSFLVPALEARVSAAFGTMTASELTLLEDHVLVLGYGDLTEPLLDELAEATDVVVVTDDTDRTSRLRERSVSVLTADPTDESSLTDASIAAAAGVVVATADDARDVLAVLAVRQVAPDVRVVAAATDPRHVAKLEAVGADVVLSPAVIGGHLLGRSVLGDDDALSWIADAGGAGGGREVDADAGADDARAANDAGTDDAGADEATSDGAEDDDAGRGTGSTVGDGLDV